MMSYSGFKRQLNPVTGEQSDAVFQWDTIWRYVDAFRDKNRSVWWLLQQVGLIAFWQARCNSGNFSREIGYTDGTKRFGQGPGLGINCGEVRDIRCPKHMVTQTNRSAVSTSQSPQHQYPGISCQAHCFRRRRISLSFLSRNQNAVWFAILTGNNFTEPRAFSDRVINNVFVNKSASALLDTQQTFLDKKCNCPSHRVAINAKPYGESGLRRQLFTGLAHTCHNLGFNFSGNLSPQGQSRFSRKSHLPDFFTDTSGRAVSQKFHKLKPLQASCCRLLNQIRYRCLYKFWMCPCTIKTT